jgi:hypothetical protein
LKPLAEVLNLNRKNSISVTINSVLTKGCFVQYEPLSLLIKFLFAFCISSNLHNKISIKTAAKQVNESLYNLEFSFEGLPTESFNGEVMNALFGEKVEDLKNKLINKYPKYGLTMYMIHYLKTLLGIKHKFFGDVAPNVTSPARAKTPLDYVKSNIELRDGKSKVEPNAGETTCSLKLILLLDKKDLFGKEIDKRYNKQLFTDCPPPRLLDAPEYDTLMESPYANKLINPKTLESLKEKCSTVDYLSALSFAEDFLEIKKTLGLSLPQEEFILNDTNLSVIEEEVFDWTVRLGSLLPTADFKIPEIQHVSSEGVTQKNTAPLEVSHIANIDTNPKTVINTSACFSEYNDRVGDLLGRREAKPGIEMRSCVQHSRSLNKPLVEKSRYALGKFSNKHSGKNSVVHSEDERDKSSVVSPPNIEETPKGTSSNVAVGDSATMKHSVTMEMPTDTPTSTYANVAFAKAHGLLFETAGKSDPPTAPAVPVLQKPPTDRKSDQVSHPSGKKPVAGYVLSNIKQIEPVSITQDTSVAQQNTSLPNKSLDIDKETRSSNRFAISQPTEPILVPPQRSGVRRNSSRISNEYDAELLEGDLILL